MINLMEYNMLGKQNISLLIMQESAIYVNFHYDLIEPDKNTDLGTLQKYCFWPTK